MGWAHISGASTIRIEPGPIIARSAIRWVGPILIVAALLLLVIAALLLVGPQISVPTDYCGTQYCRHNILWTTIISGTTFELLYTI